MTIILPAPGQEPWDATLNAALSGLDSRLTVVEAGGGGGTSASRMVPLIIFNGESNSGGRALNSSATPAELAPRPCVQILDNAGLKTFQDLDIGTNNVIGHSGLEGLQEHSWELGLANSVEAGEWWDNPVYLVKTGQGGSSIAEWGVGGSYYQQFLARVHAALDLLESMGRVPLIYLWYTLGINDAINGTNEAQWLIDVKALHARMRKEFGYFPIFMVRIMPGSIGATFNDSINAYGASDNMLYVIDETGASVMGTVFPDQHHWDYAGQKLMSSRLGSASRAFGQHEQYLLRQMAMQTGSTPVAPPADTPAIILSASTLSFIEGTPGTFTARLSIAPDATVTVTVAATGGNCAAAPTTLTFTTANWSAPQTVTVSSPDDGASNGNRSSTVTLSSPAVMASVTVAVTVLEAAAAKPTNTVAPAATVGTPPATIGSLLTCTQGSWLGIPTSYTYQWQRDTVNIAGATANTYTVVAADDTHGLRCVVTASNAQGSTAANSNVVAVGIALNVPFAWQNLTNATQDGTSHIISNGSTPGGGNAVNGVFDNTQPWSVVVDWASSADSNGSALFLESAPNTNFTFPPATQILSGLYTVGPNAYASIGTSGVLVGGWAPVWPCKVKADKTGNDVTYSSSQDGGTTWTVRYVHTGRLTGVASVYVRMVFAVPAAGQKMLVTPVAWVPPTTTGAVTWTQMENATSPAPGVIANSVSSGSIGGMALASIDLTQAFAYEIEYAAAAFTEGIVIQIDDDNTANYAFTGSVFLVGIHHFVSDVYVSTTYNTNTKSIVLSYPCKIKMEKSGNDVAFSLATGGGAYAAPFFTQPGVLAGKTIGYLKAVFAIPAGGQSIKVSKL